MSPFMPQGKDKPLSQVNGNVPNVNDAMLNWFQPMIFGIVTTEVANFQAAQEQEQVSFMGVIQPLTERQLLLKEEGQRARTWYWVHSDPSLKLEVDSVIIYLGVQYRVMTHKDYSLYGYVEYHLVEDWTGSGPEVVTP